MSSVWFLKIFLFGCVAPFMARAYRDRIKLRASHQSLALSLIWLGGQLMDEGRPQDTYVLFGWLFIYGFGALVIAYGGGTDK
jgi:hypothetical protein